MLNLWEEIQETNILDEEVQREKKDRSIGQHGSCSRDIAYAIVTKSLAASSRSTYRTQAWSLLLEQPSVPVGQAYLYGISAGSACEVLLHGTSAEKAQI